MILSNENKEASHFLGKFAGLIRITLDQSRTTFVFLRQTIDHLTRYIEIEQIRNEAFTCRILVDDELDPDEVLVPSMLIQPFVENAIWHGLLHKETAGHLTIHFSRKTPGLLECTIEDDGVGREKAKELKSRSTSTKKSLGMKLTADRLTLLNKETFRDATVEILDLKNKSGEATGTKVILKIPVDA